MEVFRKSMPSDGFVPGNGTTITEKETIKDKLGVTNESVSDDCNRNI